MIVYFPPSVYHSFGEYYILLFIKKFEGIFGACKILHINIIKWWVANKIDVDGIGQFRDTKNIVILETYM